MSDSKETRHTIHTTMVAGKPKDLYTKLSKEFSDVQFRIRESASYTVIFYGYEINLNKEHAQYIINYSNHYIPNFFDIAYLICNHKDFSKLKTLISQAVKEFNSRSKTAMGFNIQLKELLQNNSWNKLNDEQGAEEKKELYKSLSGDDGECLFRFTFRNANRVIFYGHEVNLTAEHFAFINKNHSLDARIPKFYDVLFLVCCHPDFENLFSTMPQLIAKFDGYKRKNNIYTAYAKQYIAPLLDAKHLSNYIAEGVLMDLSEVQLCPPTERTTGVTP